MAGSKKVDLQKFLNDPAHSEDKAFLFGAFEAFIEEKKAQQKPDEKDDESFFDTLFGGGKK